ncbi:hypothetical protein INT44_008025 [Umbelopsis vinacea]|uniref:Uncharacterized protein n=1 Tax=Umbelopsis vinacea TaxID=44442 RepID=A0A8H7PQ50_9FUNG|nr:hypothetical protein INT44_008025 [Umbelopsis vinacea]
MVRGRKREATDPADTKKPRRRRKVKAEPGASSSDPASWPLEEQKPKRIKVDPIDLQQETGHYTSTTLHGYTYPQIYAKEGAMINKEVKELAERVEEQQVEIPSLDLLNGIHMVGANRLFKQHEGITGGLFRRSALFALGVLMEEWAKQTAEDLKWVEDVDNGREGDQSGDPAS